MKIDTTTPPAIPWDWIEVKKNKTYGKVDVLRLKLFQPKGRTVEEVQKEVEGMNPANWAVLQYLHEHPDVVPEEWQKYWLHFFGTELRDREGDWGVPCADWKGSGWDRGADWLGGSWRAGYRVVLLDLDSGPMNVAPVDALSLELRVKNIEDTLKHFNLINP